MHTGASQWDKVVENADSRVEIANGCGPYFQTVNSHFREVSI